MKLEKKTTEEIIIMCINDNTKNHFGVLSNSLQEENYKVWVSEESEKKRIQELENKHIGDKIEIISFSLKDWNKFKKEFEGH